MSTLYLAIDPGKDQGWAVALDGRLADCGLGIIPSAYDFPDAVIVEHPTLNRATPAAGQSIVLLAIKVGRLIERYRRSSIYAPLPQTWGATGDDYVRTRVWHALDARSTVLLNAKLNAKVGGVPASKQHNVFDAVGILLWFCGARPWLRERVWFDANA